jgi:hypothetical protein
MDYNRYERHGGGESRKHILPNNNEKANDRGFLHNDHRLIYAETPVVTHTILAVKVDKFTIRHTRKNTVFW